MATSTPKENPQKSSKLVLLVIALAVLGIAAGAAAYFYLGGKQQFKETVALPTEPIFVALEPFTVNLQPNDRRRFLHVAMALKVADAKSQAQLAQYLPEVRSRVLTVLSNRESESLLSADGKNRLANEIRAALNQPFAPNLAPAKIASVMFTTFMLQ